MVSVPLGTSLGAKHRAPDTDTRNVSVSTLQTLKILHYPVQSCPIVVSLYAGRQH